MSWLAQDSPHLYLLPKPSQDHVSISLISVLGLIIKYVVTLITDMLEKATLPLPPADVDL